MAEKQHLIPEFLISRFTNASGVVRVVPRDGSSPFLASPERILRDTDFYTLEDDEDLDARAVEEMLSDLETAASEALQRVFAGAFPPSDDDRQIIAMFLAFQTTRSWKFREEMETMFDGAAKALLREGVRHREWLDRHVGGRGEARRFAEFVKSERYGVTVNKDYLIAIMVETALQAALPWILERAWRLYEFDEPSLVTSDEPLGLWVRPDERNAAPAVGLATADALYFAYGSCHAIGLAGYRKEKRESGSPARARAVNLSIATRARKFVLHDPAGDPLVGIPLDPPEAARFELVAEREGAAGTERLHMMLSGR